jgi:hypothetical protein
VLTLSCTFNKCKGPVPPIALCLVIHFPWKPRGSRDGLLPFWRLAWEFGGSAADIQLLSQESMVGWLPPRIVPPYRFGPLSKPDIEYFSSKKTDQIPYYRMAQHPSNKIVWLQHLVYERVFTRSVHQPLAYAFGAPTTYLWGTDESGGGVPVYRPRSLLRYRSKSPSKRAYNTIRISCPWIRLTCTIKLVQTKIIGI